MVGGFGCFIRPIGITQGLKKMEDGMKAGAFVVTKLLSGSRGAYGVVVENQWKSKRMLKWTL